ncbi:MAG: hypothetical protein MR896_04960 [Clostridiales bacterium]|nr:hypothetical protein [Clostridiales bacterium]
MSTLNIDDLYKASIAAQKKSLESTKAQSKSRMNQSLAAIRSDYRSNVTAAQNQARISALGLEEKLAASGLNAGSAYGRATSGYTESARVASDNNLRSSLNGLMRARVNAESEARSQYSAETAQAEQYTNQQLSAINLQKAQAKLSYKQSRYENAMQRWQTYGYVLPADAKILGVKAGTRTATKSYQQAKLAIDRIKALK